VIVSVVHLLNGAYTGTKLLDRREVEQITAFLLKQGGHDDPKQLEANAGKSFQGSIVLGMGFTFDDSGLSEEETSEEDQELQDDDDTIYAEILPVDDDTPGTPSPIATMERLIAENSKNSEVIFPYIGGREVNDSPTHSHRRYVINFGERSEEECWQNWPDLMAITERKVKPDRAHLMGRNAIGTKRATNWWLFGGTAKELYEAIEASSQVLVNLFTCGLHSFAIIESSKVFANSLNVFALPPASAFPLLQSRVHEVWAKVMSSSMKDDIRYGPSDCFETFPSPTALLDCTANDPAHDATRQSLEAIGEHYHRHRAELMVSNNEGLTRTYNRFHDPAETSSGLLELRRLHGEMDQAVLAAYGWSDVPTACGFGLDYLDTEEDVQLPDELQERIDSGEMFFWDANDALDFQGQLQAYGAITGRRKLPWRYRWPDAVRNDILARLLALNAERYAEEVAQGLHGKAGKKAAADPAAGGNRRGRPAKATNSADTGQIGLAL